MTYTTDKTFKPGPTDLHDIDAEIKRLASLKRELLQDARSIGRLNNDVMNSMTKEEKIRRTRMLPELSDGLYELLQVEGFLTGSSAYGDGMSVSPADDDWGICIPPHVFDGYALGSDQQYWVDDGFCVLYAHKNNIILNIMCFSNYELMLAWYYATQIMKKIVNTSVYKDPANSAKSIFAGKLINEEKWKRVRVFRALVDVFWSLRELREEKQLDTDVAIGLEKCRLCGREAINFTCKAAKDYFKQTGMCERCTVVRGIYHG